ncbi:hypothetical protein ETB97_007129 [Aspergillus alliaceus]|uniref:Uncharacterized protein n=1 Tax=Petromyces alliaceus TaxID=209559 RepID=A0A8H5ZWK3_PETAA|nr:hypothetical protein ETB97_007129 [Aspergillus burnettii]
MRPTGYRVTRATYTPTTVTVYQAYFSGTADTAILAQRFRLAIPSPADDLDQTESDLAIEISWEVFEWQRSIPA